MRSFSSRSCPVPFINYSITVFERFQLFFCSSMSKSHILFIRARLVYSTFLTTLCLCFFYSFCWSPFARNKSVFVTLLSVDYKNVFNILSLLLRHPSTSSLIGDWNVGYWSLCKEVLTFTLFFTLLKSPGVLFLAIRLQKIRVSLLTFKSFIISRFYIH